MTHRYSVVVIVAVVVDDVDGYGVNVVIVVFIFIWYNAVIGFLASSEEEFAESIGQAIELTSVTSNRRDHEQMQLLARQACDRFSDEVFANDIIREFSELLP